MTELLDKNTFQSPQPFPETGAPTIPSAEMTEDSDVTYVSVSPIHEIAVRDGKVDGVEKIKNFANGNYPAGTYFEPTSDGTEVPVYDGIVIGPARKIVALSMSIESGADGAIHVTTHTHSEHRDEGLEMAQRVIGALRTDNINPFSIAPATPLAAMSEVVDVVPEPDDIYDQQPHSSLWPAVPADGSWDEVDSDSYPQPQSAAVAEAQYPADDYADADVDPTAPTWSEPEYNANGSTPVSRVQSLARSGGGVALRGMDKIKGVLPGQMRFARAAGVETLRAGKAVACGKWGKRVIGLAVIAELGFNGATPAMAYGYSHSGLPFANHFKPKDVKITPLWPVTDKIKFNLPK